MGRPGLERALLCQDITEEGHGQSAKLQFPRVDLGEHIPAAVVDIEVTLGVGDPVSRGPRAVSLAGIL